MTLTRWILVSLFAVCAGGLSAQTTFTVSNTNDSGTGSLRDAIMAGHRAGYFRHTGDPVMESMPWCWRKVNR